MGTKRAPSNCILEYDGIVPLLDGNCCHVLHSVAKCQKVNCIHHNCCSNQIAILTFRWFKIPDKPIVFMTVIYLSMLESQMRFLALKIKVHKQIHYEHLTIFMSSRMRSQLKPESIQFPYVHPVHWVSHRLQRRVVKLHCKVVRFH